MRILDISLSLIGLILLSPLLGIAAVLVKASSPGPALYRGKRVGKQGREFYLLKFRTMRADDSNQGPRVTGGLDPRITRIGRFLRLTKVDELPQLFNVLRGEMSLVGPRPEDPRYVRSYTSKQRKLLDQPPGITSPASIAFRHEEQSLSGPDVEEVYLREILPRKLSLDLSYFDRRTLSGDLRILLQTLLAVFGVIPKNYRKIPKKGPLTHQ